MKVVNTSNARKDLYNSKDETLYLVNIPGMKKALMEGKNTPKDELLDLEDIGWDID